MTFAKITILGNVAYDGRLGHTNGKNIPVLNFKVIYDRFLSDSMKDSIAIPCRIFGPKAEQLYPQVKKGRKIIIQGDLVESYSPKTSEPTLVVNIELWRWCDNQHTSDEHRREVSSSPSD